MALAVYQSPALIATYFQWMIGIGIVILTVRLIYTIITGTQNLDENVNLGTVLSKAGKIIKAAVVMIVIEFVIELFKSYLFLG